MTRTEWLRLHGWERLPSRWWLKDGSDTPITADEAAESCADEIVRQMVAAGWPQDHAQNVVSSRGWDAGDWNHERVTHVTEHFVVLRTPWRVTRVLFDDAGKHVLWIPGRQTFAELEDVLAGTPRSARARDLIAQWRETHPFDTKPRSDAELQAAGEEWLRRQSIALDHEEQQQLIARSEETQRREQRWSARSRAQQALPLVFLDTETGGLSPAKHQLLEIVCIVTSPDASQVIRRVGRRVLPYSGRTIDPRALAVNGIDPNSEAWTKTAKSLRDALAELLEKLPEKYVLVAHNAPFDVRFLDDGCAQVGLPAWSKRAVEIRDTKKIAEPLKGSLPGLRLEHLCAHYGVQNARAHSALADTEALIRVYRALMQDPRIALLRGAA